MFVGIEPLIKHTKKMWWEYTSIEIEILRMET